MHTLSKGASILLLSAMSVYAEPANQAVSQDPAPPPVDTKSADSKSATDVKILDASEATTQPSADAQAAPKGKNVDASEVVVSDAGTVEIHVNEANLGEVLRMLSSQSQKNIIASKDVQGVVTANLYNVTVPEALDAILKSNGFGYREKGNFIYVYSTKELAEMDKADRKMTTEVFRLFYTPAANAQNMLKPVLSSEAQVAYTQPASTGIPTGASDTGGNTHATEDSLVVTDYPENLDKVRALLKEIDRRPQQILVEATILRAALTDDNDLGVDFNFLGGVDFTSYTHALGQITSADTGSSGSAVGSSSSDSTAAAASSTGAPVTDPVPPRGRVGGVGTGNTFTNGINGLKVGIVTNNVSIFVSALESVTDTTVLANPKILALNKQRGEVIVGRKDGYYTTTVTENATVQTVEFLETGTRLVFRPFIGDDGYVRMEIHPEDSSGGLNASSLPFKVTTEATSNVLVKDGHTIVIGGLFRETNTTTTSQVPFLGSIPVAGFLFRKQSDETTREEVIILLTPHVIKDEGIYSNASEKMMRDMEKLRVGVREGMMPTSRVRLADICYDQARTAMDQPVPDTKKAIWYLDCATNLNADFSEAVDMKESITGKAVTDNEHSNVRQFLTREILAERAAGATTQPAERSVPIRPEPRDHPPEPTTRPTATAIGPTTQPVTGKTFTLSTILSPLRIFTWHSAPAAAVAQAPSPATQPSVTIATPASALTASAAAPGPATQPSVTVAAPAPTTQPSVTVAAPAPASQPSVTVTELQPEEPSSK